jgi:hypothetical protein
MVFGLTNRRRKSFVDGAPYRKTLTSSDFDGIATANQSTIASQYVQIGALTVQAGQEIAFGQNHPNGNVVGGAPVYIRLDDTSGDQLHGKVRLVYVNPQETKKRVVYEESTYRLDDAEDGDTGTSPLLPEYPIKVPEDGKLVIEFSCATSDTVDYDGTNTRISIPATYYQ